MSKFNGMLSFLASSLFLNFAIAQYFPPIPEGITILQSRFHPKVTVSYKETHICETTPNVRSFSGYINLPPSLLGDVDSTGYNTSLFFWFFESRKDPANAPFTVWIGGGPGSASVDSAVGENGPCSVNADSNSTALNPWSWNNEVNLLYIDEPVQVGFSYNSLVNATVNQLPPDNGAVMPADFSSGVPAANVTFQVGTFPNQNDSFTVNSTGNGAAVLWHFAQTWFEEFPAYQPQGDKISLWTESYGGRYGPSYFAYFEEQNEKISNGTLKDCGAKYLHLDTLGIINGFLDALYQGLSWPEFANNNTYDLQTISEANHDAAVEAWSKPGGCRDQLLACQSLAAKSDPHNFAANATIDELCGETFLYCWTNVEQVYIETSGRSPFDIAHELPDPFPPNYALGYFSQHWVQAALGVPVNFTANSASILENFEDTGDFVVGGSLDHIADLLDYGVKVALIYGDRDYRVQWVGGETASLAVNSTLSSGFHNAGYQNITTNSTYAGGVVRQYGRYSFSRVFEAGHAVPYYQPETAYRIFMRTMFDRDVATGHSPTYTNHSNGIYQSRGPSSSWHIKNQVPVSPPPVCYTWFVTSTCTDEQIEWLADGTAIVEDFVVVGHT